MAGAGHADAIIANLKGYLDRGFEIFLSAHYGPETREDVQTKIDYLEGLKSIAGECTTADEFKQKVNEKYPGYSGANYLDRRVLLPPVNSMGNRRPEGRRKRFHLGLLPQAQAGMMSLPIAGGPCLLTLRVPSGASRKSARS